MLNKKNKYNAISLFLFWAKAQKQKENQFCIFMHNGMLAQLKLSQNKKRNVLCHRSFCSLFAGWLCHPDKKGGEVIGAEFATKTKYQHNTQTQNKTKKQKTKVNN